MKTPTSTIITFLIVFSLLTGCAVNRKLSYHTIRTEIPTNPGLTYAIATHDQREAVVDGSRDELFVGYKRSGLNIAYPVGTRSRNRFSDDFSEVIKNSLGETGGQIRVIPTRYTEPRELILEKLSGTGCDRLLLFTVEGWSTDTKKGYVFGTDVYWDLRIEVYDSRGNLMASNRTYGIRPDVDDGASGSMDKVQKIVEEKLPQKIDELLGAEEVRDAIK